MTLLEQAPPPSDRDEPPEYAPTPVARSNRNGTPPPRGPGPRVPPHDVAAEEALLGACLLKPAAIDTANAAGITPESFYKPAHGHIWTAAVDLHTAGEPVDPVTVADHLHRDGLLDQIGGPTTLIGLQNACPASSTAAKYAAIVDDHHRLRSYLTVAAEIADLAYSSPTDVASVEARIAGLVQPRPRAGTASMFSDMAQVACDITPPTMCFRADELCCFLYPGRVHSLIGPSESGKSWLSARWCAQLMAEGEHVVVLDWEDNDAGWKSRLVDMGVAEDTINDQFHYSQRDDRWTDAARLELAAGLETWAPALVVVDAMTPALATEGLDDWRGVDIATFLADVVRVCRNAGAAVLIIDHVNKADETQTGSQYKRAGIDGVQYKLRAVSPMGRGKRGLSALTIGKDRHGFLRGLAIGDDAGIGTLVVDSHDEDRPMVVEVAAPSGNVGTRTEDGNFRYPKIMERCSVVIEAAPEGVTRAGLKEAVKGNDTNRGRAILALISEGWCSEVAGTGGRIVSKTPFRADSETDI